MLYTLGGGLRPRIRCGNGLTSPLKHEKIKKKTVTFFVRTRHNGSVSDPYPSRYAEQRGMFIIQNTENRELHTDVVCTTEVSHKSGREKAEANSERSSRLLCSSGHGTVSCRCRYFTSKYRNLCSRMNETRIFMTMEGKSKRRELPLHVMTVSSTDRSA